MSRMIFLNSIASSPSSFSKISYRTSSSARRDFFSAISLEGDIFTAKVYLAPTGSETWSVSHLSAETENSGEKSQWYGKFHQKGWNSQTYSSFSIPTKMIGNLCTICQLYIMTNPAYHSQCLQICMGKTWFCTNERSNRKILHNNNCKHSIPTRSFMKMINTHKIVSG